MLVYLRYTSTFFKVCTGRKFQATSSRSTPEEQVSYGESIDTIESSVESDSIIQRGKIIQIHFPEEGMYLSILRELISTLSSTLLVNFSTMLTHRVHIYHLYIQKIPKSKVFLTRTFFNGREFYLHLKIQVHS